MTGTDLAGGYLSAVDALLRGSHLISPDRLPDLVALSARHLGAVETRIRLVDYEQEGLHHLPRAGAEAEPTLSVDGSVAGRAFRTVTPQDVDAASLRRLWVPLLDGIERLGVLELLIGNAGAPLGQDQLLVCGQFAHLVAELLVTNSKHTDSYEWVRRQQPMSLPAEMQYAVLPPLTFGAGRVVIAGLLAPAYEVGGDAFDYAVNGTIAHVAVFDAVGHGLQASLLSALAVASYRNGRRAGLDLGHAAMEIDHTLAATFGAERFVTAVLGQLDLVTGLFRWVSAGHPAPMLLRGGQMVKELTCPPALPLGLGELAGGGRPQVEAFFVAEESLQPGDRLLLITDGVDEARTADGEFFGRQRLAEFAARESSSGLPTPEVMRRLQLALLRHQAGELQDDATTLFVEWLGGRHDELAL